MEHLCECGCGGEVKIYRGKPRRFIQGHNGRGQKLSEEHKHKIRMGNTGKIVSEETRQKLKISSTGRKHSKETLKKMSESHIGQIPTNAWEKGHISWNKGKQISIDTLAKIIKPRTDGYCDVWSDEEYHNDLRGPACEKCGITNMMCMKISSMQLSTHHKNGKQNCAPEDIQTLCVSCHMKLIAPDRIKAQWGR